MTLELYSEQRVICPPFLDLIFQQIRNANQPRLNERIKWDKSFGRLRSKNPNIFAILFHFLAFMTLSLPAVGVQKAMATQHKGNVNSWSAGFQSRAGSQGVYLWVIHRANADSLPGTLGLLSPRLCIRPSSCSIKTCFKKRQEWFGECLWVLTCRVARCRESIMVGHRGWEHKGEEKKENQWDVR